ncbi:beta-1,6-N-acetylglucosaminyltransferase [Herbaspirillum sp. WKF16]|uniref:beta-1,6-N-acetylglucosaminyltransferase n=1 Tax=Herbaspirillum sp. WKF16 TaxID=3028312 RepID=UPI0023A92D30|nr:beta-1,6-N-acetylglucosaminyltransferase [Herbaspirillum sp. WKF16]WDZ97918.1 beta-1,6-N-acetylglucosaminyltransferase [Herbaspirillum sp. WKF16]
MKIAYLILAHNNPRLLSRLVGELSSERAGFFVHIDSKADIASFEALRAQPRVHFCERRVSGAWGDFSLVQATLDMMALAMRHDSGFTRVVLLSGSTLPVQPTGYIEDFFARQPDANFMEAFPMPNDDYGKSLGRLEHYWLRRARPLLRLKWSLQDLINKYAPLRDYRAALGELQPMAGSQWWAVTGRACHYMLDYAAEHRRFVRFCHHVDCSDEFFFQTILGNSHLAGTLAPSITYTNWRPNQMSPDTLKEFHLEHFAQPVVMNSANHNCPTPGGEVLFARKFDEEPWEVVEALFAANRRKAHPPGEVVMDIPVAAING